MTLTYLPTDLPTYQPSCLLYTTCRFIYLSTYFYDRGGRREEEEEDKRKLRGEDDEKRRRRGGEEEEKAPEKTEFDLVLKDVPKDKKIAILKVVRGLTGLGLKEAKDLVEGAPAVLKKGLKKEDAEAIKERIEKVGGKVVLE